jgi:hypothetical protein
VIIYLIPGSSKTGWVPKWSERASADRAKALRALKGKKVAFRGTIVDGGLGEGITIFPDGPTGVRKDYRGITFGLRIDPSFHLVDLPKGSN